MSSRGCAGNSLGSVESNPNAELRAPERVYRFVSLERREFGSRTGAGDVQRVTIFPRKLPEMLNAERVGDSVEFLPCALSLSG